jgi:hypothetical protein
VAVVRDVDKAEPCNEFGLDKMMLPVVRLTDAAEPRKERIREIAPVVVETLAAEPWSVFPPDSREMLPVVVLTDAALPVRLLGALAVWVAMWVSAWVLLEPSSKPVNARVLVQASSGLT